MVTPVNTTFIKIRNLLLGKHFGLSLSNHGDKFAGYVEMSSKKSIYFTFFYSTSSFQTEVKISCSEGIKLLRNVGKYVKSLKIRIVGNNTVSNVANFACFESISLDTNHIQKNYTNSCVPYHKTLGK